MKIIGICGPSGTGKSTFAACFSKRGIPVFDCDKIYHDLVSSKTPCLEKIAKEFGQGVIKNNALDRKTLGKIVFSDSEKRTKLNEITHKYVLDELKLRLIDAKKQGFEICLIDAPLLFESGLDTWCDFICCITATEELQIDRICQRDNISREDAFRRIQNQVKAQNLANKCNAIIINQGDLSLLESECERILNNPLFVLKEKIQ